MKRTFILDENVLEFGLSAPETSDQPSKILLDEILVNCHRIAWYDEVLLTYMPRLSRLAGQFPSSVRRFKDMLFNPEKFVQAFDILPIERGTRAGRA